MAVNEFMLVVGMIIVGLIFFMVAQGFIFGELKTTKEDMYKAEAEGIVSLIQRTMSEQGNYFYYFREISLSNVSVKNGVLTYQKNDLKFLYTVPKEVKESDLADVSSVCVLKKNGNIELLDKCPKCNMDSVCSQEECKEDCPDCYGPNSICVGDGFCNKGIGENCENSIDCPCSGLCCPTSPDSDNNGCTNIGNIERSKECWCSSQCQSGLECNPTAPTFTSYPKACCDPHKGWDGTDCVNIECPQDKKCPGAPMNGGNGDNAWIDSAGIVCCPFSNVGDISGPVCSKNHCCPTDKPKWCGSPIDGQPRCMSDADYNDKTKCNIKTYLLVFVPIGYGSDFNSFKNDAEKSFDAFLARIPLKECSDERSRIESYIVNPSESSQCQISTCYDICSDCNSKALACANSILGIQGKINKVAALCKGSTCPGACGCANGIPGTASSSNMATCRGVLYEIPSHEIGHTMGLGHVDCDVACHACPPYANNCNCPDCSEPDKRPFIMDYCYPMERYGPAAYQCLKEGEFKSYMC